MNKIAKLSLITFSVCCFLSCNENKAKQETTKETTTLKDAFKDNFQIGVAINQHQINESDTTSAKLIANEFSSLSPENNLKWMYIHPQPDVFNFEQPDKYVALGNKHNMQVVGHTLVWHSQLGEWVNQIKDSTEMIAHLENHINTIVSRYKGKIDDWDVVNEALNEDGTLRESIFLEILGEGYLERAYKLAAKADPDAALAYNDYNLTKPEKREGAIRLVKQLQAAGAKIDGIGMQGHWSLNGPSIEEIEESIIAYSELGIKVMITELDITVLPNPWDLEGAEVSQNFEGSEKMNPYPEGLPDSVQVQLAERYEEIFKLFLKHEDKIDRVTFWGLNDGNSWLNNWPIDGRTNYPLLFDRNQNAKMAYDRIVALKK
ncbi:endo-1,4-beta-xylanase [Aurantibacter crassamenti]|nr:endo-1,4-beta-xylanase [Aurantibacter crassamenti]